VKHDTTFLKQGIHGETLSDKELDDIWNETITVRKRLIESGHKLTMLRLVINQGDYSASSLPEVKKLIMTGVRLLHFLCVKWYAFLELLVYLSVMIKNQMAGSYELMFLEQAK